MRRVRSKDTTPERKVRSLLHRLGFRFRLHRQDLPGMPDLVFPKYSTVVFVHGCFWHRHPQCSQASTPSTRRDYWLPKFKKTVERDCRNQSELRRRGWNVVVVWECELREPHQLAQRLFRSLTAKQDPYCQWQASIQMAAEKRSRYPGRKKRKRRQLSSDGL
jgi:DNA mismatch endonuclease, patch repair protein